MAIYELTSHEFREIAASDFGASGHKERGDLQRLLRTQIEVISEDLYVLTEEFSDWEESKRRIDLLAIDRNANLVVIELKRTADGGYMELQAIRYAAMVSAMTFDRAVRIHADFLGRLNGESEDAESRILDFLGWSEPDEEAFGNDTRIILVAADFGKELTISVLWLIDRGLNIECVRLKPYRDSDRTLVDVQQIIPLPEAGEYQIQLREKEHEERKQRVERHDLRRKFWEGVVAQSGKAGGRHANITPGKHSWIGAGSGIRGIGFNLAVTQYYCQAEIYIDRGNRQENKAIFDQLFSHRTEIENSISVPLTWERLHNRQACRIKSEIPSGGYRSQESEITSAQQALVERIEMMEKAVRPYLNALKL